MGGQIPIEEESSEAEKLGTQQVVPQSSPWSRSLLIPIKLRMFNK